jgi:hypothetical protein
MDLVERRLPHALTADENAELDRPSAALAAVVSAYDEARLGPTTWLLEARCPAAGGVTPTAAAAGWRTGVAAGTSPQTAVPCSPRS